jgi:hypothetical protein
VDQESVAQLSGTRTTFAETLADHCFCIFFGSRIADGHRGRQRVDSGGCIEGQKNHESREEKTGALLEVPLKGARHTVRPCCQHLAPKMCQRASEDPQLIPLIAVSVGEARATRPDSEVIGPLLPNTNLRWHRLTSDYVHEQPSISWVHLGVSARSAKERNRKNRYLTRKLGIVGRIRNCYWLHLPHLSI